MKKQGKKLVLKHQNTQVKLPKYGSFTLKFISAEDWINIAELLNKKISDRDLVLQILLQQVTDTNIKLSNLETIDPSDLKKVGKAFVKNEKYIFKYFKDTGNFVKDFKRAIEDYNKRQVTEMLKIAIPQIQMAQDVFKDLINEHNFVFKQVIDADSAFQKTVQTISVFGSQIREKNLEMIKAIQPMIDNYNSTVQHLANTLKPQIDFIQKWTQENKEIFENFGRIKLNHEKNEFLLENGWVISPFLKKTSLEKQLDTKNILKMKNSELNTLYEDFFTPNNYRELEKMIESWSSNLLFKKRMDIFKDSLFLLKKFRPYKRNLEINPSKMILPSLISQIDGITSDYAKVKGITFIKMECRDSNNKKVDNKFDSIWQQPCYDSSEIFNLCMLEDYLFSRAFPYGQQNPSANNEVPKKVKLRPFFQFSRHKILHGEDLKYGSIDNVIRTFLLLDFLANLK